MPRIVKLVMVTPDNNNKYYNMLEKADGSWTAHYGRVGNDGVREEYESFMWDKKYKEKIKKGYKDVTSIVSVAKQDNDDDEPVVKIANSSSAVQAIINFLQSSAKDTIKQNYTVAVADVTELQIQTAQELIDKLVAIEESGKLSKNDVNEILLELYTVIPRKMKNTKDHLLDSNNGGKRFKEMLSAEQDLLDVMQGQVTTSGTTKKAGKTLNLAELNLVLGDASAADVDLIKKQTDLILGKSTKIYTVQNTKHSKLYDTISTKHEKLLYHGSRNENWWSILNGGLKIRPANAIHTGSMFGNGIYFANKAAKSIGYTSLQGSYWSGGSSKKAILALYSVNLGESWDLLKGNSYSSWMGSLNLKKCRDKGHDTVFARGGADLRNDEFIIYEEGRCKIKYLIEMNK